MTTHTIRALSQQDMARRRLAVKHQLRKAGVFVPEWARGDLGLLRAIRRTPAIVGHEVTA